MANCLTQHISVLGLLLGLIAPLAAQELIDPTRPAVSLESVSGVPAVQGAGEFNGAQGLSLIIIKNTRRSAVIDGRVIELGGRHGKFKLIEVNEDNVVLQSADDGQRVMRLFPTVSKNVLQYKPSIKVSKKTKTGQVEAAPAIVIKEEK